MEFSYNECRFTTIILLDGYLEKELKIFCSIIIARWLQYQVKSALIRHLQGVLYIEISLYITEIMCSYRTILAMHV